MPDYRHRRLLRMRHHRPHRRRANPRNELSPLHLRPPEICRQAYSHPGCNRNPIWFQNNCVDDNKHVQVGKEDYFVGADGLLMPVRKGQALPDLRHFK
jgi:hypothetical protein